VRDRYWFAVALFAAIARNMVTVLPNSAAPEHIAAVAVKQPGLLVLGDQPECPVGLPYMQINTLPHAWSWRRPHAADSLRSARGLPVYLGFHRHAHAAFQDLWPSAAGHSGRSRAGVGCGRSACSVVGTVPIRHMYGLESSVLLPILAGGRMSGRIPFFPADIADALAEMPAPRLLVITPFHLRKLLDADIALPEIAVILSATAPLSAELAAQTQQQLGCPVLEIYGSTETGQVATRETDVETTWQTLQGIALEQRDGELWAVGEVYETRKCSMTRWSCTARSNSGWWTARPI
jgi:acyl-CoA synthetase (AMP-forming)/AMP-acid ligase II